jgi:hypothetical protein
MYAESRAMTRKKGGDCPVLREGFIAAVEFARKRARNMRHVRAAI